MVKIIIMDESGHKSIGCSTISEIKKTIEPFRNREDVWFYDENGELINKSKLTNKAIQQAKNIKIALSQTGG